MFTPVAIIDNLQIKNENDFQFILGITGTDPYMFCEKFGSKWFNSSLVIITSINSVYEVWQSLNEEIQNRHSFWELGRRINLQLRANEPIDEDTHLLFHYNRISYNKIGVEALEEEQMQYCICFNKETKIVLPYIINNDDNENEKEYHEIELLNENSIEEQNIDEFAFDSPPIDYL
jgi:hypothetical protein